MYVMINVVFLLIIAYGFYAFKSSQDRTEKLEKLLNSKKNRPDQYLDEIDESDTTASVEKVFKKSSRLIELTALLDKNIMAKVLVTLAFVLIPLLTNTSGLTDYSQEAILCFGLLILSVVLILPDRVKKSAIRKRIKRISDDLPFIIDIMAVCVQSGMTIERAMRYIADNTDDINQDIAILLDRTIMKAEVSGVIQALEQLYDDVPCTEIRMFSSTLQQSIKYGSSVYEILLELSQEMRDLQLLDLEEQISKLSAKMTIPMILFIMLPLLALLAGPGMVRMAHSIGEMQW